MELLRNMISCEPHTVVYRSTGSVPVPCRRGSGQSDNKGLIFPRGSKRNSCPVLPSTLLGPQHNYGVQFKLKLSHASQPALPAETEETLTNLVISPGTHRPSLTLHQESPGTRKRAKVSRALVQGRAVTRPPDVVKEIKRGSMKEKWGFAVSYRVQDNFSLEVLVTSVSPHSPVARAGLRPGHVLTTINNWQLEAMQVVEAVQTVLLAGGFFMTLGWLEASQQETENNWTPLGTF